MTTSSINEVQAGTDYPMLETAESTVSDRTTDDSAQIHHRDRVGQDLFAFLKG
jgi:hypothetical protein